MSRLWFAAASRELADAGLSILLPAAERIIPLAGVVPCGAGKRTHARGPGGRSRLGEFEPAAPELGSRHSLFRQKGRFLGDGDVDLEGRSWANAAAPPLVLKVGFPPKTAAIVRSHEAQLQLACAR